MDDWTWHRIRVGSAVRTLATVYADPDGTGPLTLSTGVRERLDPGALGQVESMFCPNREHVAVVLFHGGLRASLNVATLEAVG